ncbi:MAG TPA: thermonuclease family protein [Chitinophagaceae bacterium]|nr:thermonuclease family protein [Chitinophagaceae bacterium]
MKYKLLALLLCCSLTLFSKPARVIRVIDGDTFVIETGERVRVIGINAPEMKTEYGEPAKQHLLAMIEGKTVDLEPDHVSKDKDVYGRLLRYVYLDGVDIDKKMVADGYAIAFLKYAFDKETEYKAAEATAKTASLGIWQHAAADHTSPHFPVTAIIAIAVIAVLLVLIYFNRRKK